MVAIAELWFLLFLAMPLDTYRPAIKPHKIRVHSVVVRLVTCVAGAESQ